jgi:DNA-binding NarL/FixJ family response regulator
MMKKRATILIVDDHPVVRAGCRKLFEDAWDATVLEAATGEDSLRLFEEYRPELVVLDLSLPGVGGLEVLHRIRALEPKASVLVFSMHESPIFAARAMGAGARGYVVKNSPPEELVEAVAKIIRGERYISHGIAQGMALLSITSEEDPIDQLSARELEILRLLVDGRDLAEIAKTLHVAYKTAANTVSQIKEKLGLKRTTELVRVAIEHGVGQHSR